MFFLGFSGNPFTDFLGGFFDTAGLTIMGSGVAYNGSVHKDSHGNVLGVFAAARDVSESRGAEQRFRTFVEAAPDAMVLASRDGTILLVNHQTERLFGYRRDELLGFPVEIAHSGPVSRRTLRTSVEVLQRAAAASDGRRSRSLGRP